MVAITNVIAELCIYILTWNVGSKYPNKISLENLLALNSTSACPENQLPDIYVISLQEVNTNAKNQVMGIFQDNPWVFKVKEYLDSNDYVKVETEQLQGLLIMLFAQSEHIPHMQDIITQNTRTGLAGIWGNKGAVSIRMSLYGAGVIFVGAHLAAHDRELERRIDDYNDIVHNHRFTLNKYHSIYDHEFVFWFGDLNFRLNGDDSPSSIRKMVEENRLSKLIKRDQLLSVRNKGKAFSLLRESLPKFPPTFKFHEGTSQYNLKRRPAWCDRILYRVEKHKYPSVRLSLQQLSYNSHPEYIISDHRPVSSEFIYKIASEGATDQEVYKLTHGGTTKWTPFASISILLNSLKSTCLFWFIAPPTSAPQTN